MFVERIVLFLNIIYPSHKSLRLKPNFSGKKILVVDDDRLSAYLLQEFLESSNADITIAYDGLTTKVLMEGTPFDLVLLDIKLGDCNGIEMLPKLRALNPKAIIIAQTANAVADDYFHYLTAGFDDFIFKPINLANLITMLEKYL